MGVLSNCKVTPFASREDSRKAQQRVGILGEAIPLCWNAAAAALSREPFGLRLAKSAERRCRRGPRPSRHWLLDWVRGLTATCTTALLCAFPTISGVAFQFETTP